MNIRMKKCGVCGADISAGTKICPSCGVKNEKPFYRKLWFWAVIAVIIAIVSFNGETQNSDNEETSAYSEGAVQAETAVLKN